MMKYNTTLKHLPSSEIAEFQTFLKQIKDITLLTYGESDLPVEKEIKSELINSVLDNHDHYTSSYGLKDLRQTISQKENTRYHLKTTQDNVLITFGSTEAMFLVLSSLINKNDEVIIVKPYYPLYIQILSYLNAKIKIVECNEDFVIDLNDFKKKINNKTKAIILNYPNNPSGSVLSKEVANNLAKILIKYQTQIILDNVYDEIVFDKQYSLLDYQELHQKTIIVNSLSKSQRLTGWRLGYLVANQELVLLCNKLHQMINVCLPHFMMDSMRFALNNSSQIEYYQNNVEYAYNFLKKLKLDPIKPSGGYYIIFNIKKFNLDSLTFCKKMALEYQLGLLPGIFFGLEYYVRISISYQFKKLVFGLNKLKKGIKTL